MSQNTYKNKIVKISVIYNTVLEKYVKILDRERLNRTSENLTMTMQDKARELLAQDRQHQEHLQETMRNRVIEEEQAIEQTQEQARELLVQERLHDDHLHEAMLTRASQS